MNLEHNIQTLNSKQASLKNAEEQKTERTPAGDRVIVPGRLKVVGEDLPGNLIWKPRATLSDAKLLLNWKKQIDRNDRDLYWVGEKTDYRFYLQEGAFWRLDLARALQGGAKRFME